MAEMDEVGLAALDLIIAKKRQNLAFIDDIWHAVETVGHIAEIAHGVVEVTEATAQITEVTAAAGGAVAEGGFKSLPPEVQEKMKKNISLEELVAIREKLGGKEGGGKY